MYASLCLAHGSSSVVLEAVNLVHNAIGDVLGDSLGHLAAVPPLQEVIDAPACKPRSLFRAGREYVLQPAVGHQIKMSHCIPGEKSIMSCTLMHMKVSSM